MTCFSFFFSEQSYRTLKSIGFEEKLMEEGGRDHCIRRNTLKFDGTLTQYSETEFFWIFPVNFHLLPLLFRNEWPEVMKKRNWEAFQPGILHPCSFKFRCCTCCNQLVLRDLDIIFWQAKRMTIVVNLIRYHKLRPTHNMRWDYLGSMNNFIIQIRTASSKILGLMPYLRFTSNLVNSIFTIYN